MLGCWFGVDRSTITRAIGQIRPLLAQRGCRIAPGHRLTTLAEVIAYLSDSGQSAILDATEIRVRRPAAGTADRARFVSGKEPDQRDEGDGAHRCPWRGALLRSGTSRIGRRITQARQSGLLELLSATRNVEILADAGYQGLSSQTGGQVVRRL
ncbi:hypothetical protein [Nonomuraea sp. NPDC003754]